MPILQDLIALRGIGEDARRTYGSAGASDDIRLRVATFIERIMTQQAQL